MEDMFSRTRMLLGDAAMDRLKRARVAVFGVGGVGGHVVEALTRSGVGALDRQIIATQGTLGMLKVDAAKARVLSIDPDCQVVTWPVFFLPETADQFDFTQYDYVVDAIDTVAGKLQLIEAAKAAGVPVISAMGAGNKLDPTAFRVADISETSVCPLARVMRRELRKRGIKHVKVVYSTEPALSPAPADEDIPRRSTPGSVAFVPAVAGLVLAGEVIKDLIKE